MAEEQTLLKQARRIAGQLEQRVETQKRRVEALKKRGGDAARAQEVLATMEHTLAIWPRKGKTAAVIARRTRGRHYVTYTR